MTADPFADRIAGCAIASRRRSPARSMKSALLFLVYQMSGRRRRWRWREAYRCVHGIVGVGPTVGFPASANAAHHVEDFLRPPQQQQRGLTADEILLLTKTLKVLREVAARELQSFHSLPS